MLCIHANLKRLVFGDYGTGGVWEIWEVWDLALLAIGSAPEKNPGGSRKGAKKPLQNAI